MQHRSTPLGERALLAQCVPTVRSSSSAKARPPRSTEAEVTYSVHTVRGADAAYGSREVSAHGDMRQ